MTGSPSLASAVVSLASLCRVEHVRDAETLETVHRLRYRCYRQEGIIGENSCGRFADDYDDGHPGTVNFLVRMNGEPVAAIRVHALAGSGDRSPSLHAFHDVLGPMLDAGMSMMDHSRLVVARDVMTSHPQLIYFVLRIPFAACAEYGTKSALASVRHEHVPFWRRMLYFNPVCPPRPYPGLDVPLALLMADYEYQKRNVFRKFPFLDVRNIASLPILGEPAVVGSGIATGCGSLMHAE